MQCTLLTCLAATLHPLTIAVSSRIRDTNTPSPKGIFIALPATAKRSGSNGWAAAAPLIPLIQCVGLVELATCIICLVCSTSHFVTKIVMTIKGNCLVIADCSANWLSNILNKKMAENMIVDMIVPTRYETKEWMIEGDEMKDGEGK